MAANKASGSMSDKGHHDYFGKRTHAGSKRYLHKRGRYTRSYGVPPAEKQHFGTANVSVRSES